MRELKWTFQIDFFFSAVHNKSVLLCMITITCVMIMNNNKKNGSPSFKVNKLSNKTGGNSNTLHKSFTASFTHNFH